MWRHWQLGGAIGLGTVPYNSLKSLRLHAAKQSVEPKAATGQPAD